MARGRYSLDATLRQVNLYFSDIHRPNGVLPNDRKQCLEISLVWTADGIAFVHHIDDREVLTQILGQFTSDLRRAQKLGE